MSGFEVSEWVSRASMACEYSPELGDDRRTRRAVQVGLAISEKPEASFPAIFEDEADLEAWYRLARNPAIIWTDLLSAHHARTVDRAKTAGEVAAVHDTTDVTLRTYWSDERRGQMSKFTSRSQGFLGHTTILVSSRGQALPLGVLELQPFVHESGLNQDDQESRDFWQNNGGLFENEHQRWFDGVTRTEKALAASGVRAVHIMDCEADSYGLLSWLSQENHRFVVRSDGCRKLQPVGPLREIGTLKVRLGERFDLRSGSMRAHPPRRERETVLTVRAGVVRLQRAANSEDTSWSPGGRKAQPKTLDLNLVEAIELNPPAGERGVRWLLLATEPIDTADQIQHIIDLYRRRWLVEEFFKALKTGCRLEARQMESAASMLRVLAFLVPAAWRLLLLRAVATQQPDAPWNQLFTPLEFRILKRAVPKASLEDDATVTQCMFAVAKLGGHLPRNGPPGWQTLQTGWRQLQDYVTGSRMGEM
jgi:hypothetical protein